jgi:hypothetical protein
LIVVAAHAVKTIKTLRRCRVSARFFNKLPGLAPNRIDLLTSITGVEFEEVWQHRVPAELDGVTVAFIGKAALIKNKRATGRPQDNVDLEALGGEP